MKYKFVTLVEGENEFPSRETFKEAFTDMFSWVKNAKKGLSWQVLETAIWIDVNTVGPIYFYDACDKARNEGILNNYGELI